MIFTISASTATHIYSNSGIYPPIINRLTKKYAFSITCSLSKISKQKFGLFYKLVYICKRNKQLLLSVGDSVVFPLFFADEAFFSDEASVVLKNIVPGPAFCVKSAVRIKQGSRLG